MIFVCHREIEACRYLASERSGSPVYQPGPAVLELHALSRDDGWQTIQVSWKEH